MPHAFVINSKAAFAAMPFRRHVSTSILTSLRASSMCPSDRKSDWHSRVRLYVRERPIRLQLSMLIANTVCLKSHASFKNEFVVSQALIFLIPFHLIGSSSVVVLSSDMVNQVIWLIYSK